MNHLLELGKEKGLADFGREALRLAISSCLEEFRRACLGGANRELDDAFWSQVAEVLAVTSAVSLQGVRNGTGVVLHTNLGRAPWPPEAAQAAMQASAWCPVEMDLATGTRGGRGAGVEALLTKLTGAEAGFAVNNNAAAVLLALYALARGRKVVVARGELVEIGGSYRMPEVVAAAGATMVEIGTTNKVHLQDYETALADPEVACVLKAHTSNFRIEGFTDAPDLGPLTALCREHAVPFVYDIGSGILCGADLPGLEKESTVKQAVDAGCDLVTFSGDKLLGGPQAGLIVGAEPLVTQLRKSMLARCLRLDKTILAALEATLGIHALGPEAAKRRIPTLARLNFSDADFDAAEKEASTVLSGLDSHLEWAVVTCSSKVGSGASPTEELASRGLEISRPGEEAEKLATWLRQQSPPIFTRLQDGKVLLDLRTW